MSATNAGGECGVATNVAEQRMSATNAIGECGGATNVYDECLRRMSKGRMLQSSEGLRRLTDYRNKRSHSD